MSNHHFCLSLSLSLWPPGLWTLDPFILLYRDFVVVQSNASLHEYVQSCAPRPELLHFLVSLKDFLCCRVTWTLLWYKHWYCTTLLYHCTLISPWDQQSIYLSITVPSTNLQLNANWISGCPSSAWWLDGVFEKQNGFCYWLSIKIKRLQWWLWVREQSVPLVEETWCICCSHVEQPYISNVMWSAPSVKKSSDRQYHSCRC